MHLCSLLEVACQPNSEIGTSSSSSSRRENGGDDGREEKNFDAENAYESLTLKFRKKIVRFVTKEVIERGKISSSSSSSLLCEPDSEEFWRRVYRYFVFPSGSKKKKKKKFEEEEEEENEGYEDGMEMSRVNATSKANPKYYHDDEDEDDEVYEEEEEEEEESRYDKTQQIEDFFHVLQTKEKYLLESVDELVTKFERLPRCLARDARDCFVFFTSIGLSGACAEPDITNKCFVVLLAQSKQ